MLSICSTVKNRSLVPTDSGVLPLFPNCVKSIVASRRAAKQLELIVADWQSDDWPVAEWLYEVACPVPVKVLTHSGTFSRGRGLNAAAAAARGEILFFIDSDALVSESVLRRGIELVQQGKAYFPIIYSFTSPQHDEGYWRDAGFGHCMLSKEAFESIGGWPEYNSWGREDDDFWTRVSDRLIAVREPADEFFHQWHPDDIDFKNRYGEETAAIGEFRARAEQAALEAQVVERLRKLIPSHARFILVDEDRTDIRDAVGGQSLPFLERNGCYFGPPTNDLQAIEELERLRADGARFLVFSWIAFWWLEYYSHWLNHLNTTARCLEKSDLLVVYDLQQAPESNQNGNSPQNL